MNRFTDRERLLLVVLGGLLLLILIFYLLIPQVIKYQELRKEIEETVKKSIQLAQINEELAVEQDNLFKTEYQLHKLNNFLNKELRDGSIYIKLNEGARDNNVIIKQVVPQKIVNSDVYLHLPIIISFSGDYCDALAYMQWLENMDDWANLSEITQFDIRPADEFFENNNGVVNITMTLSLYSNLTPEDGMQMESLLNTNIGRSNGFVPVM